MILPDELCARIAREARAAFPRECCGLIEGVREGDAVRTTALHPTRNLAAAADRFEIDPAEQFRLMRDLRGSGHELVGCYHSHPDGRAEPSGRDLLGASDNGFVWLIAALTGNDEAPSLAAFVFEDGAFHTLAMTRA